MAVLAALLMLVSMLLMVGCDFVEVDPKRDLDTVLAKVGGEVITKRMMFNMFDRQKGDMGITDEDELSDKYVDTMRSIQKIVLDNMVDDIVRRDLAKGLGMYPLTEEQQAKVTEKMAEYRQKRVDSVMNLYNQIDIQDKTSGQSADVDKEKIANEAVDMQMAQNYCFSEEMDRRVAENEVIKEMLEEHYTKDVTLTDEELKQEYDELLEMQKTDFKEDTTWVVRFLTVESFQEDVLVYYPGDVVRVNQIFIPIDETSQAAIRQLRTNGESAQADTMRDEALEKVKDQAQEAYDKAKAGEDFNKLMDTYNQDPGMQTEEQRKEGYVVAKHSTNYITEFRDAAVKLTKVGEISDLVASDSGYHIIMATEVFPERVLPFEEVEDKLRTKKTNDKKSQTFLDVVSARRDEMDPKVYYKRLAKGNYTTLNIEDKNLLFETDGK